MRSLLVFLALVAGLAAWLPSGGLRAQALPVGCSQRSGEDYEQASERCRWEMLNGKDAADQMVGSRNGPRNWKDYPETGGGSPVARPPGARAARPVSTGTTPLPRTADLLTLNDLRGYQCPGGAKLVVESCYSKHDEANCSVVQAHLAPRNGFQITTRETRGVLTKRVSVCKVSKVVVNTQGMVVFLP